MELVAQKIAIHQVHLSTILGSLETSTINVTYLFGKLCDTSIFSKEIKEKNFKDWWRSEGKCTLVVTWPKLQFCSIYKDQISNWYASRIAKGRSQDKIYTGRYIGHDSPEHGCIVETYCTC